MQIEFIVERNKIMDKVGFIGLGIMGTPMALNLLKHQADLHVYDVRESLSDRLVSEGAVKSDPSTIGSTCSVIFLMLPSGGIVKEVLFGEEGVCTGLVPGTVVCDMSSVAPEDSLYCSRLLREKGCGFLDAPVSGGEPKAVDGTLSFMAGGDDATFQKVLPYLEMMGSSALLVGDTGTGSIAKLANQIIVNMTIASVSEAFVFATKAGADPEKVYKAIRGGLAGSAVLDAKLPMILERNFVPGGPIYINHKDIKNVVEEAHLIGTPIPLTSQLFEIMQAMKVRGHMGEDHCGIVKYFENLADCKVQKRDD